MGRLYEDDALYREGVGAVDRAIALAPQGRLVDDPELQLHSADELKAVLEKRTPRRRVGLQSRARISRTQVTATREAIVLPLLFLTVALCRRVGSARPSS